MTTYLVRRVLVALLASFTLAGICRAETDAAVAPSGNAEAAPRDIVLVLDNSGSMKYNDRNFVTKEAAAKFIRTAPANTHVSLIVFDEILRDIVTLGPPTGPGRETLFTALANMNYQGHLTNIPEALKQALTELKERGRDDSRKAVVLLTDGVVETGNKIQNGTSRQALIQDTVPEATALGIRFYTIALGKKSDMEFLQALARRSEGEYFWIATGNDLPIVFDQFTAETRQSASVSARKKNDATTAAAGDLGTLDTPAARTPESLMRSEAPAMPDPNSKSTGMDVAVSSSHPADNLATAGTSDKAVKKHRRFPRFNSSDAKKSATPSKPAASSNSHSWWFDAIGVLIVVAMTWLLYMMARTRRSALATTDGAAGGLAFRKFTAPAPQAVLNDLTGVTGCQRHEIDSITTLIGRVPPAPHEQVGCIVIDRQTIGRRHAVIERKHYGFWLIDQHSKNGTYINDQRVTGEVCLSHGDRIRFHEYDFEFNLAGMGLADDTVPLSDYVAQNLRKVGGMQR